MCCSVATPNKIIEFMKVDGITNDKVKIYLQVNIFSKPPIYLICHFESIFHLKLYFLLILYSGFGPKYHLHTKRPSPSPPSTNPQAPQLVVIGGIWVYLLNMKHMQFLQPSKDRVGFTIHYLQLFISHL